MTKKNHIELDEYVNMLMKNERKSAEELEDKYCSSSESHEVVPAPVTETVSFGTFMAEKEGKGEPKEK